MHVRKRPIQSVSVSDNVLNISGQITACQLFIMASRIDSSFIYFFTASQNCHTHSDDLRSKNTPRIMTSEISNGYISSIKKKKRNDILSSRLNNYHVHLKYQFSAAPFAFYM